MPKTENVSASGVKRSQLSGEEETKLNNALKRSFEDTRALNTRSILDKILEYQTEIEFAAEVAKRKLDGSFDGGAPESGNFGIDQIHPGYFGYDDWDSMPDVTGGEASDWLDSHSPTNLNSGSTNDSFGDPLGVGDPVTHLILGFGSYAPDPVVSKIKFEKNDQPEPTVSTETAFRNTDLRVQWLDTPQLLQPRDDFSAKVFAGGEEGQTYSEAVYPIGVSFVEAKALRQLDPANMAGTDEANIVVEQ